MVSCACVSVGERHAACAFISARCGMRVVCHPRVGGRKLFTRNNGPPIARVLPLSFRIHNFLRQIRQALAPRKTVKRRPEQEKHSRKSKRRLQLEGLEDRLAPASFADNGTTLNLALNNANTNAAIVSNGTSYT